MKTQIIALLGLAFLGLGCSSYRLVRNESDKAAPWSTYQTFAFVDTTQIEPIASIAYRAAMREVEQAVAAELTKRGYQQVSVIHTRPDLVVNVGAVVDEKTQTRQTTIYEAPRYIGQRRYHWQSQEVPVGTYQEGTISLHVVDNERENLLWDVAVSGVVGKKGVTPEQIREAIRDVFAKFPGNKS